MLLLLAIETQQGLRTIHDRYTADGQRNLQLKFPVKLRGVHDDLNRIVNANGARGLHRSGRYRGQVEIPTVHLPRPSQHVSELLPRNQVLVVAVLMLRIVRLVAHLLLQLDLAFDYVDRGLVVDVQHEVDLLAGRISAVRRRELYRQRACGAAEAPEAFPIEDLQRNLENPSGLVIL